MDKNITEAAVLKLMYDIRKYLIGILLVVLLTLVFQVGLYVYYRIKFSRYFQAPAITSEITYKDGTAALP